MDFDLYLRFALALILVLGLIAMLAWLMRRFGMGMKMTTGRRLGIVEVQMLGPRHRMMLIRRDEVEHLVIVGPATETVVESGIRHAATANQSFAAALANEEPKP